MKKVVIFTFLGAAVVLLGGCYSSHNHYGHNYFVSRVATTKGGLERGRKGRRFSFNGHYQEYYSDHYGYHEGQHGSAPKTSDQEKKPVK